MLPYRLSSRLQTLPEDTIVSSLIFHAAHVHHECTLIKGLVRRGPTQYHKIISIELEVPLKH